MLDELTVDRAAIFTDVCRRNALRREAHLPLLNAHAEYERLVAVQRRRLVHETHYTHTCAGRTTSGWVSASRARTTSGVPFHFKQWGGVQKKRNGRLLDGRTWDEFPVRREEVL